MKLRYLKPLRVCIALAFFLPIAFLFLDFWDTGVRSLAGELLYLQFVPSLLKFLRQMAMGATGFIAVLVLTLVFGRIYCATICPLGTLQDLISRLFSTKHLFSFRGKRQRRRPKHAFSPPRTLLRYTIFSLTVLVFLLGSGFALNLLDPFSSFGRIFSNILRPVILALNNLAVPLMENLGINTFYRVQWPVVAPVSLGVALATLSVAGWLSARHGRLYCNTLCPLGALLGLVANVSLLRIGINKDTCKTCGLCETVCKAGCIDIKSKTVDTSRCVACCNCLTICPEQSIGIEAGWRNNHKGLPKPGRRGFMIGLAAGSMATAGNMAMFPGRADAAQTNPPAQSRPTTIPENKTCPLSPPGSAAITRYTSICTACHLCVAACPSRVLVPSFLAFGLSGMMQPQMNFASGHCNYDCIACTSVCPSGALLPLSKTEKQRTQVGVAKFIKENCVVYTDNTNCGACSEHCPTKAVHMVPYLNAAGRKLVIPEVNEAICVGCGGCEHACPTKPFKAIYVNGNPVHKIAEKPREEAVDQKSNTGEDFPF